MHYTTDDGRQVLDGTAGLWCVNAGHCRPKIVEAIQQQAADDGLRAGLPDGPPEGLRSWPARWSAIAPEGLNRVFFTNSGSESVDTALKIALAYHRVRGDGARTRLIGRERGYHGVGFGGISVGGIAANRKHVRPDADRRRPSAAHPHDIAQERVHARRSRSTAPNSPTNSRAHRRAARRRRPSRR